MNMIHGFLSGIGPFFLLLGLLIFVHELGHFLVAKFFGVRVEVFSLGFGRKLFSYQGAETNYCISLIPLGGYVKMFGDDPSVEVSEADRARAFLHKPVLQRIAIVLAGPLMNLFFAAVLLTVIFAVGEEQPGPYVGDLSTESRAFAYGFRSGDQILSIDGSATPTWLQVRRSIEKATDKDLEFSVQRSGEAQALLIKATPTIGDNDNIFSFSRQVGTIPGFTSESRASTTGVSNPQSPAAKAGVKTMDLIVAINDTKVTYWREVERQLEAAAKTDAKTLRITVRDIEAAEKPENNRQLTIELPEQWNKPAEGEALGAAIGLEPAELYIYQVKKDSPAAKAGLQPKDKVTAINNEPVRIWSDVLSRVKSFDPQSGGLEFTVLRNGEAMKMNIRPEMTQLMNTKAQEERRFTIGIVSGYLPLGPQTVYFSIRNPLSAIRAGLSETGNMCEFLVMTLVRLFQGDVSPKNIGGVITIGRVASHSFAAGFTTFLKTMAIISINLFLLNLLPVPILDGGHLVFYTIEGLRGTPLSMRKMELAQQIGLMLLMFLMVFAFFNDITNLLSNRW